MKKSIYFLLLLFLMTLTIKVNAQSTASLPYFENFDNHPEGTLLPDGWLADSKSTVKIGHWNEAYCDPYSAPDYLQFMDNNATYPRNDWAYTVGFDMQAGKTYYTSFWLYAAGYSSGNLSEKIKFTVGKTQTQEAHETILENITGTRILEWTQIECQFIPETSGVYYFGFNIYTSSESNGICVDNFEVYSEDNPPAVEAEYTTKGGIWSAAIGKTKNYLRYVYPDQPIYFINKSKYAVSYSWETFGNPATSEDEEPVVHYTQSGLYEPVLTATNSNGSETYKDTVNVVVLGEEEITDVISNREKIDGGLYKPEDLVSNGYEYISGINRYYNTFAEKFDMPADAKLSINSVSLMLYEYKLATKDRTKPVIIKIYGDAEGVPDPENVFGSHSTTMSQAFGTGSLVEEQKDCKIQFSQPIEVTGTFYVSIEIDETVKASTTTYIGCVNFYKSDYDTKAFVYIPEYDEIPQPEIKVGEGWYPVHELPYPFYELEGLSFYLAPNVTFHKTNMNSISEPRKDNLKVYPTVFENTLTLESAGLLDKVIVYDITGSKTFEATLKTEKMTIDTSGWVSGIYVVSISGNTTYSPVKIIKY